ncbi:MAG: hypothetical protein ACC613_00220 [Synergistales bacterium]
MTSLTIEKPDETPKAILQERRIFAVMYDASCARGPEGHFDTVQGAQKWAENFGSQYDKCFIGTRAQIMTMHERQRFSLVHGIG